MSIYDYQDDLYATYVGDVPVEFFIGEFDGNIEAAVDNLISEEWWSTTSGSAHDWTPPDDLRQSLIAYCERTLENSRPLGLSWHMASQNG